MEPNRAARFRRVWKYPLQRTTLPQQVRMPTAAKIVHVAWRDGVPYLWAEVDPETPTVDRFFALLGTGDLLPPGSWHVGTASAGAFHLYECVDYARDCFTTAGMLAETVPDDRPR